MRLPLLLALAVHAIIILGFSFAPEDRLSAPKTLEVTLATYESQKKPEKVDYLAQINQQGSGTLEKKAKPSTDQKAELQSNEINKVQLTSQEASAPKPSEKNVRQLVTQSEASKKAQEVTNTQPPDKQLPQDQSKKRIDIRQEIASLEAQFRDSRQQYANRPRIKRLTSASTMQESGAYYKEAWRRKAERIGNLNYPAKARQQGLYGQLRLMVAIRRDGSLADVKILKSSGYRVLDDAAIRIVKLAAPYAPFTGDLRNYDIVEIIRSWRFEPGNKLFSN